MRPVGLACKRRKGVNRVADEAADGVGVESEEEGDKEMVRVPERLERLLADASVCRGEHEQHTKQHDVARDAARLGIVNLQGRHGTDLRLLDVEEVDVVCADMKDGEKKQRICQLPMHPEIFVERQEPQLGSQPAHYGAADGKQDQHAVNGQNEPSATRDPN